MISLIILHTNIKIKLPKNQ